MESKEQVVSLSVELVTSVLQYLGTRPYIEVNTFISGIQAQANDKEQEQPPLESVVSTE